MRVNKYAIEIITACLDIDNIIIIYVAKVVNCIFWKMSAEELRGGVKIFIVSVLL